MAMQWLVALLAFLTLTGCVPNRSPVPGPAARRVRRPSGA